MSRLLLSSKGCYGRIRYDLANRLNKTVKDFQQVLNEKIALTLEGMPPSFQKALAMHQKSSSDVEENLAGIFLKLRSHINPPGRVAGLPHRC